LININVFVFQNGESIAAVCSRLAKVIARLHRECSDKRVVIVCHGEVMWAFRVILERMSQVQYKDLDQSTSIKDKIHNCQILHYTRRCPKSGKLHRQLVSSFIQQIVPLTSL